MCFLTKYYSALLNIIHLVVVLKGAGVCKLQNLEHEMLAGTGWRSFSFLKVEYR